MQRVENISSSYHFRDNIQKYISYFQNIQEFYQFWLFIFNYLSHKDKADVFK